MAQSARDDNDLDRWSVHGGRRVAAETTWPEAPRPWLDLSTGINPVGFDPGLPVDWRALPDEAGLAALEALAARHFGLAADHVCAVPGSELGLRLLGTLELPGPIRHVAPAYGTHAAVARDGVIDADALEREAEHGGTILLANPNNPDGRIWPIGTLTGVAARLARRNGLLVVDEAFADVDPEMGILGAVPEALRSHLVTLRSFGKFFGLAGLRLGFVCATPDRLAAVRDRIGSWPVSAAAIAIGSAAYGDAAWIAATRQRLVADAARLDTLLLAHGFATRGGCPLFRLIETPRAHGLFEQLARQGILTRPFHHAANWLRIGLPGGPIEWDKLERALRHG